MKKNISDMYFSRMSNEVHLQFLVSIAALLAKMGDETHGMEKLAAMFRAAIKNEEEALDYIAASVLTTRLTVQDSMRSRLFRGFARTVEGYTEHYLEDVQNSALLVQKVLKHYGNVIRKPLDAKTAAIDDIAREFSDPAHVKALAALTLTEWFEKITEADAAYQTLTMERFNEAALRTPHRMKTCRPESERIYRALTNEIENQMLTGSAAPGMTACIAEWNAIVTHFKSISRHTVGGSGSVEGGRLEGKE